jgi:hypothetical protein
MDNFIKFLIKAKKNTYASNGEFNEKRLKDGAKELVFSNNNFFYRDRYYGSKQFTGEEVVFVEDKPYWTMNYYGGCINDKCQQKEVYVFLKKCLKRVNSKTIFRGPEKYEKEDFIYINKIKGSFENFYGEEVIYFKNKKVYKLKYHGGLIE